MKGQFAKLSLWNLLHFTWQHSCQVKHRNYYEFTFYGIHFMPINTFGRKPTPALNNKAFCETFYHEVIILTWLCNIVSVFMLQNSNLSFSWWLMGNGSALRIYGDGDIYNKYFFFLIKKRRPPFEMKCACASFTLYTCNVQAHLHLSRIWNFYIGWKQSNVSKNQRYILPLY